MYAGAGCCGAIASLGGLRPLRLLGNSIPLALTSSLPFFRRVLHLGVFVRAFIKQLRIDLHE